MEYKKADTITHIIKISSQFYSKNNYVNIILLLEPLLPYQNLKLYELLAKSYFNLSFYKKCRQVSLLGLNLLKPNPPNEFTYYQQASFLNLIILSQIKLNNPDYKEHSQYLNKVYKQSKIKDIEEVIKEIQQQIKESKTHKEINVQQIFVEFQRLINKSIRQRYFQQQNMPVYIISTTWLQKFQAGSNQPINSFDLIQSSKYLDLEKGYSHMNYLLKRDKVQQKDYIILAKQPWDYIHKKFSGVQIKRFTIKVGQNVIVQANYLKVKVWCVTNRKNKLIELQISRTQTILNFKNHLKRILIWQNLIEKEQILKPMKIMHLKDVHSKQEFLKLIINRQEQKKIAGFKIIELHDLSQYEQADISPNQFIILEFMDKNSIFESVKQTLTNQNRCFTCTKKEDKLISCDCNTVKFCSLKCKKQNRKHTQQCLKIVEQKNQIPYLIRQFQISKNIKLPKNFHNQGKTGLENIGNTCFMNAALQCLGIIQNLTTYFLKNQHLDELNISNRLGSQGKLACAYGEFLKELFFTQKRAIQPRALKKIIQKKNSQFAGYQQQDSQQFLSYFLDLLHEDLNRVKNKPIVQNIQSDGRPDQIISKLSLEAYKKRNQSIITDLMVGQYKSQLSCPDCKRVSITFDPYMNVTLPLPNTKDQINIQGYKVNYKGGITKFEVKYPKTKKISDFYQLFENRVCSALIVQKKLSQILSSQDHISKAVPQRGLFFVYQIQQGNIQIQLTLQNQQKSKIMTFSRRIFKKIINTQTELEQAIMLAFQDPIQRGKLKQFSTPSEFIQYCRDNQFFIFGEISKLKYPLQQKVYKINVSMKNKLLQKLKLLVSHGSEPLKPFVQQLNITNVLKNFSLPQQLTQDNAWYCSKCKDHKLAEKKLSLYTVPTYLILHLKRFSNRIQSRYVFNMKIDSVVHLNQIQIINGRTYQLIGVVNHMGSMSSGHYTSYIKKNEWYYCDDESVKPRKLNGQYAYLLFYKWVKE